MASKHSTTDLASIGLETRANKRFKARFCGRYILGSTNLTGFKKLLLVAVSFSLLSACASRTDVDRSIERRNYNAWENEIGYSQVVRAGKTLYISGIASNKPTLEQQVEEIYSVTASILNDYGLTTDAIVKQVIYTTDIDAYKSLGEVRKRAFKEGKYPSSTLVQIERLYDASHLVEIEVVAYIE